MNSDPFRRLRAELHDASARVHLAPGSELTAIRTAHRRRQRRRAVVGATAVVAVGAGTTVAIQQLGKTSPGDIVVGNTGTSLVDQAVTDPGVTTTIVAGAGLPQIDAQPPVRVDSRYTWNVLTPDAAATLGPWRGRVPGVVIATAPGAAPGPNGMPEPRAYYTADGVTFEALDVAPSTVMNPGRPMFADGNSIYRVGTAAGVAADAANPMLVEVSDDRGASWNTVELPLDTHALRSLPFVVPSFVTNAVTTDAGVLVAVTGRVDWDYRQLVDGFPYWEPHPDGVVAGNGPCGPVATTMPLYTVPTTTAGSGPAGTVPAHAIPDECTTRLHTWAELGVPQESIDAVGDGVSSTTSLFLLVDGQPTEVAPPQGFSDIVIDHYRGGLVGSGPGDGPDVARSMLTLTADRTWVTTPIPPTVTMSGGMTQASATHQFALMSSTGLGYDVLGSSNGGGEWAYTELAGLHSDIPFPMFGSTSSTATDDGYAGVVQIRTDTVAQAGGVSFDIGSATLSRSDASGMVVVTDDATGALIEGWTEQWSTEASTPGAPAAVDFVGPDGTVLGSMSTADYEVLQSSGYDAAPSWFVVTTADGVNIASESVAELAGVSEAEISNVRVNAVGRQLIVSVVLTSESTPGVLEQRILVGTPND